MKSPKDFHPDLTDERLNAIADILINTRNETVDLFDEDAGDKAWGLGCRVYDRTHTRIIRAAQEFAWLSVADPTLHLIFNIGQVPVRFYSGTTDDPNPRTLAQSYPELQQLSLAFPKPSEIRLWRFAVEADTDGKALRVVFAGFSDANELLCQWVREAHEPIGHAVDIGGYEPGEGVDMPEPAVTLPKKKKKDENLG